ncbi:protein kinase [Streptomyces sp. NPDC047000]|uniref:serine/threonine-protein kinase n=1 Tax=Streptomyces sp. NPDC047000 TaxID=3155474 RepID=UPI0033F04934
MNGVGTRVGGRYRLEALLGRGGMGEVWRAYDPRLERRVAVKFLPAQLADDSDLSGRFRREARVTAQLQHPGITQVFDSGAEDGQLHLVMELLDGRDLAAVLREQPTGLPVHRAVGLASQTADALAYAHRQDVVHRDVKPANLMLLPGGRVKVCDFGIAGFVRADSGLTRDGSVMGTPDYMAPEQCLGQRVDGRADLYALGCVLFALLTGRPPFTVPGDFRAVMLRHLHAPPPRLSERRPGLPAELDFLVTRLLSKDPGDRPAHGGAVADLLRALADRPVSPPAGASPVRPSPVRPATPGPRFAPTDRPPAAEPLPAPAVRTPVDASGPVLEVFHSGYLAPGVTDLDLLVTVRGTGAAPADVAAPVPRTVVFLTGLSAQLPGPDFAAVVRALREAVAGLDDGVSFALVAGSEYARMLYPDSMRAVRANAVTKAEADAALSALEPVRAAAFGRWIRLADRLFAGHPEAVRTAILLSDMKASAESPDELSAALASCAGRFVCHARGIGTAWEVSQLASLTRALNGTLDIFAAPSSAPAGRAGLSGELAALLDSTRRTVHRDLALRVTAPEGTRPRLFRQVAPGVEDLSDRGYPIAPGAFEYPVDAPDNQSRDYHLGLDLPPADTGTTTPVTLDLVLLPPTGDGRPLTRRTMTLTRRPAAQS